MKISFKTRWYVFISKIKNFIRKIRFNKINKSRLLKKELKKLVSKYSPQEIPFALNEKGFYKFDGNMKQPSIEDLCEKAIELAIVHFGPHKHFELVIYDEVPGYEDTLLISYIWCNINKNEINGIKDLGLFIDKTFSYQTREEKIKNIILKFANDLA